MGQVDRFLGWSYQFKNGLHIGFNWVHGNGRTAKTIACIAGYHHPNSITWRWALYWHKPSSFKAWYCRRKGIYGEIGFGVPIAGGLCLSWQPHMMRKGGA